MSCYRDDTVEHSSPVSSTLMATPPTPTTSAPTTTTKLPWMDHPAHAALVESVIINSNQKKLAKLQDKNAGLEHKMKLMAQQYGDLIDQLSRTKINQFSP